MWIAYERCLGKFEVSTPIFYLVFTPWIIFKGSSLIIWMVTVNKCISFKSNFMLIWYEWELLKIHIHSMAFYCWLSNLIGECSCICSKVSSWLNAKLHQSCIISSKWMNNFQTRCKQQLQFQVKTGWTKYLFKVVWHYGWVTHTEEENVTLSWTQVFLFYGQWVGLLKWHHLTQKGQENK